MITSKLSKDERCSSLLIQFSTGELPHALHSFYENCRQEGVLLKRSALPSNHLYFYKVTNKPTQMLGVVTESHEFHHVLTVLYVKTETDTPDVEHRVRTIIIREGLQSKFSLWNEVEECVGERETISYLCEVSASLIRAQGEAPANFYDQKVFQMKGEQTGSGRLWHNALFQVPGMGKDKCLAVAHAFPSYQALLRDYHGPQNLANTCVQRGQKQIKLGTVLATRIYRCFTSTSGDQSVFE